MRWTPNLSLMIQHPLSISNCRSLQLGVQAKLWGWCTSLGDVMTVHSAVSLNYFINLVKDYEYFQIAFVLFLNGVFGFWYCYHYRLWFRQQCKCLASQLWDESLPRAKVSFVVVGHNCDLYQNFSPTFLELDRHTKKGAKRSIILQANRICLLLVTKSEHGVNQLKLKNVWFSSLKG